MIIGDNIASLSCQTLSILLVSSSPFKVSVLWGLRLPNYHQHKKGKQSNYVTTN
jgi:hypothetical protein